MPSKNDLSSLKAKPKNTLKKAVDVQPVQTAGKAKVGRKAKPAAEKESFSLMLKLTEAEGQKLKERAGMVPLATYVKAYLRGETDLLD